MKLFPTQVPPGYRCPICVEAEDEDHKDDTFYNSSLFESPICEVCDLELSMIADDDEPADDITIELAERLSGRNWRDCRVVILQDGLRYLERINAEQPEEWFQPAPHDPNRSRGESQNQLEDRMNGLRERIRQLSGM